MHDLLNDNANNCLKITTYILTDQKRRLQEHKLLSVNYEQFEIIDKRLIESSI